MVFYVQSHVICKRWQFYFFLSNLNAFYFFFLSDCCGYDFSLILTRSSESRHPCLFPHLKGNVFAFAHWVWLLAGVCPIWPLLHWGMYPLFSFCLKINGYCIWYDHMVSILHFVYVVYHVNWFAVIIITTFHPMKKYHLIMVCNLFRVLGNYVC